MKLYCSGFHHISKVLIITREAIWYMRNWLSYTNTLTVDSTSKCLNIGKLIQKGCIQQSIILIKCFPFFIIVNASCFQVYPAFNLHLLGLQEPERPDRAQQQGPVDVYRGLIKPIQVGCDHQATIPDVRHHSSTRDRSILQEDKDVFDIGKNRSCWCHDFLSLFWTLAGSIRLRPVSHLIWKVWMWKI